MLTFPTGCLYWHFRTATIEADEWNPVTAVPYQVSCSTTSTLTAASPEFYKEGANAIARTIARAAEVEQELLTAYERWDDLESRR